MNKMKLLLVSCGAFLLAACQARIAPDQVNVDIPWDIGITTKDLLAFESEVTNKSLQVGEVSKMNLVFYPQLTVKPYISYSTSNSNVVSIDDDGNIVAKNNGFAVLTANCGGFSTQCFVSVTEQTSKSNAKKVFQDIASAQASSEFVKTNYLGISEYSHNLTKKDGVDYYESFNYEKMVMDKDAAYLYLYDTIYEKSIIENAPFTYEGGMWLFYCTDEFETYVFHEAHGSKRYMTVDCASYYKTGDRFAAMCAVIDNVFSSGSEYFLNQFKFVEDSETTAENVDYVDGRYSNVKNVKYRTDGGNAYISYDADYGTKTIRPEDYSQTGLESGIVATETVHGEQYYFNNRCRYMNINFLYDYEWRGSTYQDLSKIQRQYDLEEKKLYYPDIEKEGWGEGEDIFDI